MSDRDELVARILRAQQELQRGFVRGQANPLLATNLTMRQLQVLLALSQRGGSSGHELTSELGVSLATVTGIIDRLAAQGLVSRREDPQDRRVRRLELTAKGQELIKGIAEAGVGRYRSLLERLNEDELHSLELVVLRLCQVAQEIAAEEASEVEAGSAT